MTRELWIAAGFFLVLVGSFAVYLCKLAWSGVKKPGQLSSQWQPDEAMDRHQKMKARNER